jgi:hypothetical protein
MPAKTIELTKVFDALKKETNSLKTYLTDVDISKIDLNNYTLKVIITSRKVLSAEEIDYIKNQVFLTAMELPNVNTLDLTIGEEAFILKR